MPAITTLLMVAGLGAEVGAGIATNVAATETSRQMNAAAKKQEKAQQKLLDEAKAKEVTATAEAARDVKLANQRQRQIEAASRNKGGTDLVAAHAANARTQSSSPLGLMGSTYGAKTLLGR